jgi:hypothetical protein
MAATGELVILLDQHDTLAEYALYLVANAINADPDAAIVYSDEDEIDRSGRRSRPYFKPDWDDDLFLGTNLLGHLAAYRTELAREAGGVREGSEGALQWDLALRMLDAAPSASVRHAFVLYHRRHGEVAASPEPASVARRASARGQRASHSNRPGCGRAARASAGGSSHPARRAGAAPTRLGRRRDQRRVRGVAHVRRRSCQPDGLRPDRARRRRLWQHGAGRRLVPRRAAGAAERYGRRGSGPFNFSRTPLVVERDDKSLSQEPRRSAVRAPSRPVSRDSLRPRHSSSSARSRCERRYRSEPGASSSFRTRSTSGSGTGHRHEASSGRGRACSSSARGTCRRQARRRHLVRGLLRESREELRRLSAGEACQGSSTPSARHRCDRLMGNGRWVKRRRSRGLRGGRGVRVG